MAAMVTGIFGGSFNPIHIGHLALANYLCEFAGLEELWFLVSPQNPLKAEEGLLEEQKRLELVQVATEGYPKFHASDFEFRLPRPSYTIYTLDRLKEQYPEREFVLIVGSDNWRLFDRWKESERLLRENRIFVYPRPGYVVQTKELPRQVTLADSPVFEISSTFIREALRQGRDIRYFLHPAVYEKIVEEKLFTI